MTYGYYPYYYMYPSLFVFGCLNITTLEKRRREYLCRHFFKLITGIINNPQVLMELNLYVPDDYSRSRSHVLFYIHRGRTNVVRNSPINRAMLLMNRMSDDIDIFNVTYQFFCDRLECLV
jgi:hypothetical protein